MPTVTPGPPPDVEDPPACEFATVSINEGAVYRGSAGVALRLCAPRATQMMVSNDGGFANAQWEPFTPTKSWQLSTYGAYIMPRYVYVAFKDAAGFVYGPIFDDIIFDPAPPKGAIAVAGAQDWHKRRQLRRLTHRRWPTKWSTCSNYMGKPWRCR
ncbi:MAG: hypothetical protein IPK16_04840 [Anaerolineales bacterium]|nr:hypothetical protein [Anaerolineales bacterium]